MKEEWKEIDGFPNYMVSNLGRIKSLNYNRTGKEQILMQKKAGRNKNYFNIILFQNGKSKTLKVHRLVAQAFIPNPNNYPCVNHKDENPSNNFVCINEDGTVNLEKSNLEWCTYEYNNNYGTRNKKVSETLKGRTHTITQETRNKMSESKKGEKNPNYGKKWGYK